MKINGFISTIMLTGLLLITTLGGITHAQDEVDWMPDENLRLSVRIQLGLKENEVLTKEMMRSLTGLDGFKQGISDLTGLEHAPSIVWLILGGNEISDITPLASLKHLESLWIGDNPILDFSPLSDLTNLKELGLGECGVSDIDFLRNLTKLQFLVLHFNQIKDITPVANLVNLRRLWLTGNLIEDASPLANLRFLEELKISVNYVEDVSLFENMSIESLEYDAFCELPRLDISKRVEDRDFPSIFNAWYDVLNRPSVPYDTRLSYHDLYWSPDFDLQLRETSEGFRFVGDLGRAREERDALLALNPNMVFLVELRIRDAFVDHYYTEDWAYWLRDEQENKVPGALDYPAFLIDFTRPELQDIIVEQCVAIAKCGLYDGVFFDWWSEEWEVLRDFQTGRTFRGLAVEKRAREAIIRRVREAIGEDFLIIVNPNRGKPTIAAPYINGLFMETGRDHELGYTHTGLLNIEDTLLWAEENLQSPVVNCLEGWGVEIQAPDSELNLRWMRTLTALGLTHSDGYFLYIIGIRFAEHKHDWQTFDISHKELHDDGIEHNHHHDHYWYDFWDAALGKPVGEKGLLYNGAAGLFIREFENGWAVYNRSGKAGEIHLPEKATGVASSITATQHIVPDLDGEIYLKAEISPIEDVNGDGVVNILDLAIVANAIGKAAPDINADGIVNVLDLIVIANAF